MKYSFISLIFSIFLFIKPIKSSPKDNNILEMDEESEVTDDLVFIKTSSIENGKEMLIEIKAESFLENNIIYEFVDDTDDTNKIGINIDISSPYNTKIDKAYISNYYKIKKELGTGVQGKFLALIFNCSGEVTVGSTYMPSTQENDIIKKNKEISLKASEGGFIFDSSDFNVGDKIYFKIKAKQFNEESLFYEFCDDLSKYYPKYLYEDYYESSPTKTEKNSSYIIKYFTIEKNSRYLEEGKTGKYLIAYFDCEGTVTIKNTPTDEGNKKASKTFIIILVVIVVIIVVGSTAFYCYRNKKKEGGFCSGNKDEIEVYNNEQINNYQNPNNVANNNYQTVNVQNNKKTKNPMNQNNNNTPNYNNMNSNQNIQNTPNYNNMNYNQNNQNTPIYNNMNYNQNTPIIQQNNQIIQSNQMYPNNLDNNNQGYTSAPANENYTSSKINAQNYDINIDSNNQLNQNGNIDQMNNNAAPFIGISSQ